MPEPPQLSHALIAAAILLAVTLTLQWLSGAYESDIGIHADEPSHFVTGVMMRDYVLNGLGRSPMPFVEDYYEHYPKVALGHYPPGFYLVEGAWMIVFSTATAPTLVLSALFSALFGWMTWRSLATRVSPLSAAVAGLLCCGLPLVQRYTSIIMSDLMLSCLCFAAALAFARYLETGKIKFSLGFGLFAAAAILTKGAALFLALLPGVAILLAGKISWVKRPSLWIAALPVVVFALPWMLFTYHITSEGMATEAPLEFARQAIPFYLKQLAAVFGFAILLPALAGVASLLAGIRNQRAGIEPFWAVVLATPVSLLVFYCLVPSGLDSRYLLPAVPAVLALAVLGIERALAAAPQRFQRLGPVLAVALVLFFFLERFYVPVKHYSGYSDATETILEKREAPAETILIVSDAKGEGTFIAELARREPHPELTVLRSSKELGTSDWMGRGYEPRFKNAAEMRDHLADSGIEWIVTDTSVLESYRPQHHDLLEATLKEGDTPFVIEAEIPAVRTASSGEATGILTVYRRLTPASAER